MSGIRNNLNLAVTATLFALVVGASASVFAQGNLLINGDFEDTTGWGAPGDDTTPPGWIHEEVPTRKNAASAQTGVNAIGGSGVSAYLPGFPSSDNEIRRDIWNVGDATGPLWTLQYDFATEDPGGDGDRSLSCGLELTNTNRIVHRVTDLGNDGIGDLQIYDGSDWQLVLSNAIQFDSDVTTTPVVNHITFTGRSNMPNPVYDVTITSGLGTFTATDLDYYRYSLSSKPVTGAEGCNFNTFLAPADSVGNYLIDNVVLTQQEPVRPDQYIVNGDFEDTVGWGLPGTTEFPADWTAEGDRKNAAFANTGSTAIGGSGTSASLQAFVSDDEALRREIRQVFSVPTTTDWEFDVDLAAEKLVLIEDGRSLSFELSGLDGGKLIVRVTDHDSNNLGDVQFYDGAWQTIAGLDNSIDLTNEISFGGLVNHLKIVGHYGDETPSYDVYVTNSSDVEFSAVGLEFWSGSAPSGELGGLSGIAFNTFNSQADYMIDNVSLVDVDVPIPGDADGNGVVDAADAQRLAENWGATTLNPSYSTWREMGDFNNDHTVNVMDAAILAANWSPSGEATAVPEPGACVLLLSLFVLAMLRRSW